MMGEYSVNARMGKNMSEKRNAIPPPNVYFPDKSGTIDSTNHI